MRSINLFVEDRAHELFLDALIQRFAEKHYVTVTVEFLSAKGGHGAVINELKSYISDFRDEHEKLPDLLIVGIDGNCKGFQGRKREIDSITKDLSNYVICAVPDPHIERWLLLDSAAFKKVLGKGCAAPSQKCERDLYKKLLKEAVKNAGVEPSLGGVEYTDQIVNAMNLEYLEHLGDSLSRFLKELRQKFQEWEREQQKGNQQIRESEIDYDPTTIAVDIPSDNPPT